MPRSPLHPFPKSSGHPNSMNKLPLTSQQWWCIHTVWYRLIQCMFNRRYLSKIIISNRKVDLTSNVPSQTRPSSVVNKEYIVQIFQEWQTIQNYIVYEPLQFKILMMLASGNFNATSIYCKAMIKKSKDMDSRLLHNSWQFAINIHKKKQ